MRDRPGGVNWWVVVLAGLVPMVFFAIRLSADAGSAVIGVGGVAGIVLLTVGIIAWSRRRPARQLVAMEQGGTFRIDVGVSFDSFPGDGKRRARRSMIFRGMNQPFLPCTLAVEGDRLTIEKRTSFGMGRRPFAAEVALGDIAGVEIDKPTLVAMGSTLIVHLRDGSELRGALAAFPSDGQRIADLLHVAASGHQSRPGPGGVVVTTPAEV